MRSLRRAFLRELRTSYWLSGVNLWVEHFAYRAEVHRRAANIKDIRERRLWSERFPDTKPATGLNRDAYGNAYANQYAAAWLLNSAPAQQQLNQSAMQQNQQSLHLQAGLVGNNQQGIEGLGGSVLSKALGL